MGEARRTERSPREGRGSASRIFLVFPRIGVTSFGGPVAHLGYFSDEFVARRKWIEELAYADFVEIGS